MYSPQILLIASDSSPRTDSLLTSLETAGYGVRIGGNQVPAAEIDVILLIPESASLAAARIAASRALPGLGCVPLLVWLDDGGDVASVLGEGADDCVAGAANMPEVLARLEALVRRAAHQTAAAVLSFGTVRVDLRRGWADVGEGNVSLTPKELQLFSYLAAHSGAVVARQELLREVWGYQAAETRTVDTHMAALRRKLERDPRRPRHLFTIRGRGYQFRQ